MAVQFNLPARVPPQLLQAQDVLAFAQSLSGVMDYRRHVLRSEKAYPTGGQTKLTFFDQNIGAATKLEGDTNLQQPSVLSNREMFIIMDVRVWPLPAQVDYYAAAAGTPVAFGEWMEVMFRNCWLDVKIGRKKIIDTQGPLGMFNPGFGPGTVIAGNATVTKNVQWPNFGTPDVSSIFILDPPVTILPGQVIECAANWITAVVVTTAGKLGVYLNGYLFAEAQ